MVVPTLEEGRYSNRLERIEEILNETADPKQAILKILQLEHTMIRRLQCDHTSGQDSYRERVESIIREYAKRNNIEIPKFEPLYGL